jgi:glycosyltransferase involved in cell wall biosynthesis
MVLSTTDKLSATRGIAESPMNRPARPTRVLYSFPHKIGENRICNTAWQHVNALAAAGADMLVFPGVLHRPLPEGVKVRPTLARGKFRIPYKVLGSMRAFALHDWIVSRRLEQLAGQVDIVHTWPLGALLTLQTAKRMGITTVLERPNAYTRYAYEVVQKECERLGVSLPPDHEHAYHADILEKEEIEYRLADRLLCPSDFVMRTFRDAGFPASKLARHQYGFDQEVYHSDGRTRPPGGGLKMLFVGGCAPRKGVHYALEAWLQSGAQKEGTFQIAGQFVPGYAEKLAPMVNHPSVMVLGHRRDIAELMRASDILILPSIEEGSALVTSEARGSGCVLLVSEAAGAICQHMENALVHRVGDVQALAEHIRMLNENRMLLETLRAASLRTINEITWSAAGARLLQVYQEILEAEGEREPVEAAYVS